VAPPAASGVYVDRLILALHPPTPRRPPPPSRPVEVDIWGAAAARLRPARRSGEEPGTFAHRSRTTPSQPGLVRPNHLQPPLQQQEGAAGPGYMRTSRSYLQACGRPAKYFRQSGRVLSSARASTARARGRPAKPDFERARQLMKEVRVRCKPIVVLDPHEHRDAPRRRPFRHGDLLQKIGCKVEVQRDATGHAGAPAAP